MSKTLQMILSLLRKQSVSVSAIVPLLQSDNIASILGIDSLLGSLISYNSETLSEELTNYLIKVIELSLNEQKEMMDDSLNSLIVSNSSSHYQEIVTSQGEDTGNQTIISEYTGKIQNEELDFYALVPQLSACSFIIGELGFDITPVSEFTFTLKDGTKTTASYKYKLKITCVTDPVAITQKLANFKLETLFHVLGMSYLNSKHYTVQQQTDQVILNINTHPFFKDLAEKYNIYYSNLRTLDGLKFSDFSGIDTCYIDEDGPILVPKMFYLSSMYTDGDIGTLPFIYDVNKALPPVDLQQNPYRISINYPKEISDEDANAAIDLLIAKMADAGVNIFYRDSFQKALRKGDKNVSLPLNIDRYNQFSEDNGGYQSSVSAKLACESKVSKAFRSLCRNGNLGPTNYFKGGRGNTQGTEQYAFIYNKSSNSIVPEYERSVSKFMIYFNRSAFTMDNDTSDSSRLVNTIIERNSHKFTDSGAILEIMNKNSERIEYNKHLWPNVPSNYIPTSFIPITFTKREGNNREEKAFTGLSFIPFGFTRHVQTERDISPSEGGFSIYGSDFGLIPASVRKVIKLSSNPNEVPNIVQIIVESKEVPEFLGDAPLRVAKLGDTNYFLCLFKTVSKIAFKSDVVWSYASNYIQPSNQIETDQDTTTTLRFTLSGNETGVLSNASFIRYIIETSTIENEFINSLMDSEDIIFQHGEFIELSNLLKMIVDDQIVINSIPKKFFTLLYEASLNGTINDNVIDWIVNMVEPLSTIEKTGTNGTKVNFDNSNDILNKSVDVVRNFIRSIQKPVKTVSYPTFDVQMQMDLTNSINAEIDEATEKVYTVSDSLVDKTAAEIKAIATSYDGILRTFITMISDKVATTKTVATKSIIVEIKNEVVKTLRDLVKEPILPKKVGSQIKSNFIILAAEELHKEVFTRFIKMVYANLSTSGYTEYLTKVCREVTSYNENFNITALSPYLYNVTFNSIHTEAILSLDNLFLYMIGLKLNVSNKKDSIKDFGEHTYDPSIYCLFSVSFDKTTSISDLIFNILKSGKIYYTQIGDTYMLTDISVVSLCGFPKDIQDDRHEIEFFLPYIHNNGRLTVDSKEWKEGTAEFKLKSSIVEVEIITTNAQDYIDTIKKVVYTNVIDISDENIEAIESICIGLEPAKKSYEISDRTSHYIFTHDLKPELESGTHTRDNGVIENSIFYELPSDSITIHIYPVFPIICKHRYNEIVNSFKQNAKIVIRGLNLNPDPVIDILTNFINNYDSYFVVSESIKEDQKDEILIVRNPRGIYTEPIINRFIESKMASFDGPYHQKMAELKMDNIDELTNIDKLVIQDKVNIENEKLKSENTIHNLALILSNVRWNTVVCDNYRFYSNERPKWMKFSNDSYFMAIGFQSGVKIYIRSGTQYIFCNNLIHEGVKEIIFGNKQLCITLQYEDSNRDFGHLWITATGYKIPIEIPFYTPTDGDAVNIKYISGNVAKEKKNVFLTIDKDDKMKYESNFIQNAVPIFNHNVYFFSPDDSYMITNKVRGKKGTFVCYDINKLSIHEFTTVNNIAVKNASTVSKGIENGVWVSDNIFVGITYSPNDPKLKMRITINVETGSITQVPLLPEFPTSSITENMLTYKSSEIHPLYSYLMEQRSKYVNSFTGKIGVWVYDTYVSLKFHEGKTLLVFETTNGIYNFIEIPFEASIEDEDNLNMLINLISICEFQVYDDSNGVHISMVTWMGKVVFDRFKANKLESISLPCIDGNFFSFYGDNIYTWRYLSNKEGPFTELTHISSDGYGKVILEAHVALFVTDVIKAVIVIDNYLAIKDINIKKDVNYSANSTDISTVTEEIKDSYTTSYLVHTEQVNEKYNHATDPLPFIIDSKPVSSVLCLNRFPNYNLKSHSEVSSSREGVVSHDNLIMFIEGNVVKIVPRTVQISKDSDGLINSWYKQHPEDNREYWLSELDKYERYLNEVYRKIPQLNPERVKPYVDFTILTEVFKPRDHNNIESGYTMAIDRGIPAPIVEALRFIFSVFGLTKYLYSASNIIDEVKTYWSNRNNKITEYLKRFPEEERNTKYDEMISVFEVVYGNCFISSMVGDAFLKIESRENYNDRGIKRSRTVNETLTFFADQLKHVRNSREFDELSLIVHILNIPVKNIHLIQISTVEDFASRLSVIKDEISKINQMLSLISKFDKYVSLEQDELVEKYKEFVINKMVFCSKSLPYQSKSDFILTTQGSHEVVNSVPADTFFDADGLAKVDGYYYFDLANGNYSKISEEYYDLMNMKDTILDSFEIIAEYILTKPCEYIFKSTDNILETICQLLGRRELHPTKDVNLIDLSSKLIALIIKRLKDISTVEQINIAKSRIGEDVEFLISIDRKFNTVSEFIKFINNIYAKRYQNPLYTTYGDNIPELFQRIFDTYNVELPDDTEKEILSVNNIYIEKMFRFYSSCLKRKYYVNNGTYSDKIKDIRSKMIPLLWKYRNGVTDENLIPVTAIKLTFQRNVRYKKSTDYNQSEWKDIMFEYEMPENDVKHDVKYGTIKVNLVDILSELTSHANNISRYAIIQDIENSIDTISDAFNQGIITEKKSMDMVKALFPPVDSLFTSLESYKENLRLLNMDVLTRETENSMINQKIKIRKFLTNFYSRMNHFVLLDNDIEYNFDYKYAAVGFGDTKIKLSYSSKYTKTVTENVVFSKKNIACGTVRPYFFEPKLVYDENGNVAILTHAGSGVKFIVYYGNTMKDNLKQGFIVTQDLIDRKMTTYLYRSKTRKNNNDIYHPTFFTNLVYNSKSDEIEITEIVEEERFVRGKGYEKFETSKTSNTNITTMINRYTIVQEMTNQEFSRAIVTSSFIKTKGVMTLVATNYRIDSHYGTTVDIFVMKKEKNIHVKSLNFYMMELRAIDFNKQHLVLVSTTSTVGGMKVRVGLMNMGKGFNEDITDVKSQFVTSFDREIEVGNNFVESIDRVTCDVGSYNVGSSGTTMYVTYKGKDSSYLLIFNNYNTYEVKIPLPITSVKISKENGFIALYFEDINKTDIWICSGSLYKTIEGECNWM